VAGPLVGVIMGSDSDLPVMQGAIDVLAEFGVAYEVRIVSAHRTPDVMYEYAHTAADRGLRVIVAGAGGAAHLPGMTASMTPLPVIGVPVPLRQLDGLDSLLSIVQMPAGVPVATVAVGNARNAGLLAVRILAAADDTLRKAMERYQDELAATSRDKDAEIRARFATDDLFLTRSRSTPARRGGTRATPDRCRQSRR
jgi:5-(carboxyamino)imidazole ribonucleotide mutase